MNGLVQTIANPDAERALLGAVLMNPGVMPDVLSMLPMTGAGSLFSDRRMAAIWEAVLRLHADGEPIEPVAVHSAIDAPQHGITVAEICALLDTVETSANASHHARTVAKAARVREVQALGRKLQLAAPSGNGEVAAILADLGDIVSETPGEPEPANVADMLSREPSEMECIFHEVIPAGALTGVDAEGGTGKSWLTLELCVSLAIGRALIPAFEPVMPRRVLYYSSEDHSEEIHRRLHKVARAFDLGELDRRRLVENLVIYPGTRFPVISVDDSGVAVPTAEYHRLRRRVREVQPGLLAIDPIVHFLGSGDENGNTDRAAFMTALADLTSEVDAGMAVWLSGHVAKGKESDLTSGMGRGAGAHRDAMRSLFGMAQLGADEAEGFGVTDASLFCKLKHTKSNWSARTAGTIYLQRDSGETGGVLKQIDLEAQGAQIAATVTDRMARRLAELLGSNPADLSCRDVASQKAGLNIQEALKDEFPRATRASIQAALDHGIERGYIVIDTPAGPGKQRRIPRENLPDAD